MVIALRPLEAGAVQVNATDVDAEVPATLVGLSGTVAMRIEVDLADSGELPAEFFAMTVNVNKPSRASPEI